MNHYGQRRGLRNHWNAADELLRIERMKNALRKDFIREIRKNPGRFLSILLIVLLGAAFFSGIRSAGGQMKYSADLYYDQSKLMDIRVLSTLGLTEDDLEALQAVEGVELVRGGTTKEVLLETAEDAYAVKLIAQTDDVNLVTITDGREPQKVDECVMDDALMKKLGYQLGDVVTLRSGTEDPLTDDLNETEFTVVGTGLLPYYMDTTRGVGTIGSGTLEGFLVLPPEAFDMDIYTEVYVRIAGAEELNSYSDKYKTLAETVVDRIEEISDAERQRRYDEIVQEGTDKIEEGKQEIADAEAELADAKEELDEGKAELDDAKEELDDGKQKLDDAKEELADGKKELDDAKAELADGKKELDDAAKELKDGQEELDSAKAELDAGAAELADAKEQVDAAEAQLADAAAELAEGEAKLTDAKAQLDAAKAELDAGEAELAAGKAELDAAKEQLDAAKAEMDAGEAQIAENEAMLQEMSADLEAGREQYNRAKEQLEAMRQQPDADPAVIAAMEAQLAQTEAQLEAYESAIQEGMLQLAAAKAMWEEGKAQYDAGLAEYEAGKAKYEAGLAEWKAGKAKYDAGLADYEAGLAEYEAGRAQYEAGLAQYEDGKRQYEEGTAEYEDGRRQYEEGVAEYEDGKRKYEEGLVEYEDGKAQYEEGLAEYKDGKKKYEDSVKEYEEGLAEYEDGLKEWEEGNAEYQEAYADARKEIAKAKIEISDAEKELAELGIPTWYILDREKIASCASFGMDADRMDSLGNVFPVLFFLVAALVSLTAMTRMVEEQRQQIGTLKALGYGNGSVAAKYLMYALLASLGGAVPGVLFGEYFLPWVIISSYQTMMYTGLPAYYLPLDWVQGLLAIFLSAACTGLATWAACYRNLKEKPADLMRPEAPQVGKRILLERITPLWKRLSFNRKSTLRNLFRYKKRLFMTLIGISGCMSLLLVGFGIRDAIQVVDDRQYSVIFLQNATVSRDADADAAELKELEETIQNYPGMLSALDTYEMSVTLNANGTDQTAYLYVPSDVGRVFDVVCFRDRESREVYPYPESGVALSEKTASMLGVTVGDTITIQKGEKSDPVPIQVETVFENYLQHYAFITPETYERLFGEAPKYNSIEIRYEDNSEEAEQKMGKTLMALEACTGISFVRDQQKMTGDMLALLNLVIWVLIGAAAMLSCVVLFNLNSINLTERQRELATLKVLGFTDWEVAMYVYRENVILTLISVVVGAVLGTLLTMFTLLTVEVELMMFGRGISIPSYVICAVLTFAFSIIVNFAMYSRFKKINMVESLKSVE